MIKRIKIRDFKSIRDVDLELDPVTVLVGRSGTGKSNLVQAIRFLRNLLIKPQEAVTCESGWPWIQPVGVEQPETSFEVVFAVPGQDRDYEYRIEFANSPSGARELVHEHLKLAGTMLYSRQRAKLAGAVLYSGERAFDLAPGASVEMGKWEWLAAPNLAVPPTHQSDLPMIGDFPALQDIVLAHAALSNAVGFYHFPSATLGQVPPNPHGRQFLQTVPGLHDDADNFRETLRAITQDFHRPELRKSLLAALRTVNPSIVSVELDSITSPQKVVVGHDANGKVLQLSLEQESDGLRRFYAHLLALYQTPPKLTLIFEEPENAIFPGALSVLAEEFKAAPREHRGQVILTTHSPILLDAFDVDNVRVVELKDGWTVVGRVAREQRDAVRDRLLTTGELLTVDRARVDEAAVAAAA